MTRKIIIDTDPGQDDAVAILAALASPELDVKAIVAVAGNVPLALTEKNSRALVELAGRTDVPVYAGCARPMMNELVTAEYVHGDSGIDGADLPDREAAGQRREALGADGLPEAELGGFLGPVLRLGDGPDVARQADLAEDDCLRVNRGIIKRR